MQVFRFTNHCMVSVLYAVCGVLSDTLQQKFGSFNGVVLQADKMSY